MIYSAADIIKRSCAQIVYFRETGKEKPVSQNMLLGMEFQDRIIKRESVDNDVISEMRGCYDYKGNFVFFCIDMIKNGGFYEIKSVTDENGNDTLDYPQWYFNSSILQCAIYKSLLLNMNGDTLVTPKFKVDAGIEETTINVDKNSPYYLIFGNVGTFNVEVNNPNGLIQFVNDKIDALKNYTTARAFDAIYKHKEFDLLSPYFSYNKVLTDF